MFGRRRPTPYINRWRFRDKQTLSVVKGEGFPAPSAALGFAPFDRFFTLDEILSGTRRAGLEIGLSIGAPSGPLPLSPGFENLPIPRDRSSEGPPIVYGEYLRALAGYFSSHSFRPLKTLLARQTPPAPALDTALSIELTSEKHGALYNVSLLRISFPGKVYRFAVNAALLPEQRAFLLHEYRLLGRLYRRFRLPGLPRPCLLGTAHLLAAGARLPLRLFVSEWFENHHEFHLAYEAGQNAAQGPRLRVWKPGQSRCFLDSTQAEDLYLGASRILTEFLDTGSFHQIYPWHHAAGDFVVDEKTRPVSVRLITARDYRTLLPQGSDPSDKLLGSLHFFINLTVRMRLDRLEGTGGLAWADPWCLRGVIRGFCAAWEKKKAAGASLPDAKDILSLFAQLPVEDRLAFAGIAAANGRVEAGEEDFLGPRLPEHVIALSAALERHFQDIGR